MFTMQPQPQFGNLRSAPESPKSRTAFFALARSGTAPDVLVPPSGPQSRMIDADQCRRRPGVYCRNMVKGRRMARADGASRCWMNLARANNGKLTAAAAAKGRAVAEARAARTLERAKAPRVAPPRRRPAPAGDAAKFPHAGPTVPRAACPRDPGHFARRRGRDLGRLGAPSGVGARQASRTLPAGRDDDGAVWAVAAQRRRSREARASGRASRRRPAGFPIPAWSQWPFNVLAQGLLSTEAWWARGDAPRARARARPRGRSRLHDARADRRCLAEQHPLAEPGDRRARRRRRAAST